MSLRLNTIAAAALLAVMPVASFATTLTFDNVASLSADGIGVIPNGYGGLNWNNMYLINPNGSLYTNSGYGRGQVSGQYVAFNASGNPADALSVSSAATFNFNSAYLTAAWNKNLNVDVKGYRNGALLYTTTIVISDLVPTLFNFNYTGIDDLKFVAYGGVDAGTPGDGTHFALDNFRFNETAQVPEPASLSLLGLGLAGFVAARRKRNG